MNSLSQRANLTNVVAACILSGGLVAAAIINSHRPVVLQTPPAAPPVDVAPPVTRTSNGASVVRVHASEDAEADPASGARHKPPIAQSAAADQVEDQLLKAPELQHFKFGGKTCTVDNVDVDLPTYSAKDDEFSFDFSITWKKGASSGVPDSGTCTLDNDGYGHYSGAILLNGEWVQGDGVTIH